MSENIPVAEQLLNSTFTYALKQLLWAAHSSSSIGKVKKVKHGVEIARVTTDTVIFTDGPE